MKYGCIAQRLTHSYSKEIHALLADYDYQLQEVAPEALDAFMRARDFEAINVTIPYKQAVIPYLAHIDPQAEAIGAVNTIVNRNGMLYGYNTDFYGMTQLLARNRISLTGKKVLILGTGGTAKTAAAVANHQRAATVLKVSRAPHEADEVSYADACALHHDAAVIINTTPCGMFPAWDDTPLDLTAFDRLEGVIDAIYNPLRSRLVQAAQARGIPAEGGLYMLVAQAAAAAEHFTGAPLPANAIANAYRGVLAQKENLVLTGMPGSGKTTVGQAVAVALGRPFVDMDAEIEQHAGCTIATIFAQQGEAAFRDLETQVAKQLAPRTELVIATGGGAVLRDENLTALRANGKLFFIDRPLEQLVPTGDRPTAQSAAALQMRFHERYDRYCLTCDVRIASNGVAHRVTQQVLKEWEA